MPTQITLEGQFHEFCDCYTICPCWVNESPDEDHCSALYVWRFAPGCQIDGLAIGGGSIAVAAFHARGQRTQSAIFVDKRLDPVAQERLLALYATAGVKSEGGDQPENPPAGQEPLVSNSGLDGLRRLLGMVVQTGIATFDWSDPEAGATEQSSVALLLEGSLLARASYQDAYMQSNKKGVQRTTPLTLKDTALHDELALQEEVVVQTVQRFEFDVSSLPGAAFVYAGRSGMRGHFRYSISDDA